MDKHTEAQEAAVARNREKLTAYHAYAPEEQFRHRGEALFSVLDFWRYAYSQLEGLGDTLAEFLVARALGIDKAENVNYWTAYDMAYRSRRIEVKSTRYVHPWNTRVSRIRTFSIEPTSNRYWDSAAPEAHKRSRQSDVYVFCLNANQDIQRSDPLRVDDWIFYVVPTAVVNDYCRDNPLQKKISLGVVRRLAGGGVAFDALRAAVDEAIGRSDGP